MSVPGAAIVPPGGVTIFAVTVVALIVPVVRVLAVKSGILALAALIVVAVTLPTFKFAVTIPVDTTTPVALLAIVCVPTVIVCPLTYISFHILVGLPKV